MCPQRGDARTKMEVIRETLGCRMRTVSVGGMVDWQIQCLNSSLQWSVLSAPLGVVLCYSIEHSPRRGGEHVYRCADVSEQLTFTRLSSGTCVVLI